MSVPPTLRPLHTDDSLSRAKLAALERLTTEALVASLTPGQEHSLKVRADGTMMDGHHRIFVLRSRGFEVDALRRELWNGAQD
jgi:hypothetical protein